MGHQSVPGAQKGAPSIEIFRPLGASKAIWPHQILKVSSFNIYTFYAKSLESVNTRGQEQFQNNYEALMETQFKSERAAPRGNNEASVWYDVLQNRRIRCATKFR